MSISPPGDLPRNRFSPAPRAAGKGKNSLTDEQQRRVQDEEREADKEISSAYQRARDAETESRQEVENIRDEYSRQYETEAARGENMIDQERQKGYEALRNLQHAQQKELRKTRQDGDKQLQELKDYYRDAVYSTTHRNDSELRSMQEQLNRSLEYEKKLADSNVERQRTEHEAQLRDVTDNQKRDIDELRRASQEEYERLAESHATASEASKQHFQDQFDRITADQNRTLQNLEAGASRKLNEIRADTAAKLNAYSSRQSDPFYKLHTTGARLHENGDAYVLTATIPLHEQDHVTVAVRGNSIVLTGYRRNEEKLEPEPGRSQSTSSFQSFTETFPIDFPVESRQVTKTFDGNQLIAVFPKKTRHPSHGGYQAKVERVRAERPVFPSNIPYVAEKKNPAQEDDEPKDPPPGSNTLS